MPGVRNARAGNDVVGVASAHRRPRALNVDRTVTATAGAKRRPSAILHTRAHGDCPFKRPIIGTTRVVRNSYPLGVKCTPSSNISLEGCLSKILLPISV